MTMLLILAVVCLMGAIALLGRVLTTGTHSAGVERSLRALEELSASPAEVAAEVEVPFTDRVLAPMHARALTMGRRFTGADQAEQIRRKLDLAGNPRDWSVDRVIGLKVLCAVVLPLAAGSYALVLGVGFGWTALAVVGGLTLGYFVPNLYLANIAQKRAEAVRRTLADAVDLLTISVEAGLGFDAALQQVARNTEGPVAEEFSRVLREMQLGMGRAESLRALNQRTEVEDLQTFVGAMVQADAFGVPIGQVLRVQSREMRLKRRQHAEMRAQQVPVKIIIPLVVCVLPCLLVVVIGPAALSYMREFGGM